MRTRRLLFCVAILAVIGTANASTSASTLTDARSARLERGLQAEEGIRAVKRLQHIYSQYLSSGFWTDLTDLFAEDAVAEFHSEEGVVSVSGKRSIGQHLMAQAARREPGLARGQLFEHLVLQPIVNLDAGGSTAKGAWHEVALLGQFGSRASWAGGVYENEYRLDHGVWKIGRLAFFQQYRGAFEDWGHKAPAQWNIPYHFTAQHLGVVIPAAVLEGAGRTPASVAELALRVQRLADENEVRNLQHTFGYYLDRKLWDELADLFTEDGTFESAPSGQYVGKAHIRTALETMFGASPLRHGELFDHLNLATVVTLSSDGLTAATRTRQLSMIGLNGQYALWELGTYEDRFVKDGGVWKIKAVHYYPRLRTDYDAGWAKDAEPAPRPSQAFPPDQASPADFHTFPEVQYVGFDFVNPVTGRPVRYPAGPVAHVQVINTGRARGSPSAATLDDVQHGLDAAIGVDAVENLNSSYGYYIDESAWDNMADTYATNGSKEITGAGVYVGPDRIRKVLNLRGPRGGRTPNFFTIHQLTQPVIHISADGNSGNARMRLFQCGGNADGSSGSWIGGIYENTAVKENGEWKFGAQVLYHIYNASYRNGWARAGAEMRGKTLAGKAASDRDVAGGGIQQGLGGAASGPRIAQEYAPDRPIEARQYAFPDIVEPPFHYPNPVTGRPIRTEH